MAGRKEQRARVGEEIKGGNEDEAECQICLASPFF